MSKRVRRAAVLLLSAGVLVGSSSSSQPAPQVKAAPLAAPTAREDGWPTTSPESVGLSDEKLRALEALVRSGELKKITSVLVARHGKLAYEAYFEGDADTLRDPRSATKSVTSLLAGIAVDAKLLSVDAKVLSFFPGRKVQNPDPRKDAITVEDFLAMSSLLECNDWNDYTVPRASRH